jgi:hypothetical protein
MDDQFVDRWCTAVAPAGVAKRSTVFPDRLRVTNGTSACSAAGDQKPALLFDTDYADSKVLAALSLAPLVAVAWAEGGVDEKERHMVLSWATDVGLSPGERAYRIVEQWLARPSHVELLTAWKTYYVRPLSLALTQEAKRELKLQLLGRAKTLVETTAPFSGIGQTLTPAERGVIDEIETALS